jgi:hypothetical protein
MTEYLPWIGGVLTVLVCGFAIREGGRDEAYGALIFLAGTVATLAFVLLFGAAWTSPEYGLVIIDAVVLLAMIHLAMVSDRFWPIWFAAFHLIAFVSHASTIASNDIMPWVAVTGVIFWAWPAKITLFIGVVEYRARKSGHSGIAHFDVQRF